MALGSGEFPSWSLAVKPLHSFLLSTQQRPCSVRKCPAHLPSSQPTVVSCPSPNTSPLVEQGPRQSLNKPFTLSCSALSTLYSFSQNALHTSTSGILFLLQGQPERPSIKAHQSPATSAAPAPLAAPHIPLARGPLYSHLTPSATSKSILYHLSPKSCK